MKTNLGKLKVSYEKALKMGPMKFVKNHLFPFMRREQGNGFAMSNWQSFFNSNRLYDNIKHKGPACGTIYCIGGSMANLTNEPDEGKLGLLLGLEENTTDSLFFRWGYSSTKRSWPKSLSIKFKNAKTPSEKEKVAEKMVLLAIKTKGACFKH